MDALMRLKDRTAIVTGAAQGLGQAIAHALADEGAYVLVTDINESGAADTANQIREKGHQADSAQVDIANADQIQSAVRFVLEKFKRIDILANNAAHIERWHNVLESTDSEWEGCLRATIMGTHNFTKAVLPTMIAQKSGSIIITSSIMGLVGCPNAISYTTVKHGLVGYCRSAARDFGQHNIRVNVVAPGAIKVGYSPKPGSPNFEYQINNTMLRRQGETREIARTVAFLASDDASYVTGAIIPVDGGWSAM